MDHPVDLVLVAADAFTEVVATPAVADAWGSTSACPPYTVGGLVAHTAASVAWFADLLTSDAPAGDPPLLAADAYYPTVDAGGEEVHAALVRHGNDRAMKGVDANRAYLRDVVEALREAAGSGAARDRLLDLRPGMPGAMTVDDFARTRLVELVVHGDDVAASVGGELTVAPAVGDALLTYLVDWGRSARGDLGLVRAFVRGERADGVLPLL